MITAMRAENSVRNAHAWIADLAHAATSQTAGSFLIEAHRARFGFPQDIQGHIAA
jgi:hypothetical protein